MQATQTPRTLNWHVLFGSCMPSSPGPYLDTLQLPLPHTMQNIAAKHESPVFIVILCF